MKLKIVEVNGKTYAEVQDGKPVYLEEDGKEVAFDAPGTRATITRLNGEAKTHREGKEAAESKLKAFEGITDPAAALKAIETVKNIDDKKLVDAGRVEDVKREVAKSFEDKLAAQAKAHAEEVGRERSAKEAVTTQFHTEKITAAFTGSKFITDKFLIPADMAQARFGNHFKVEDGALVAYDAAGNKLYSRARPAELANFDEAVEMLVDAYPYKDHILKGKGGGSGTPPGSGKGGSGKTMTRAAFDALNHQERAAKMADGFTLTD